MYTMMKAEISELNAIQHKSLGRIPGKLQTLLDREHKLTDVPRKCTISITALKS